MTHYLNVNATQFLKIKNTKKKKQLHFSPSCDLAPVLTCRKSIPDLQPVISAEGTRGRRGVGLHIKAVKLHHDLRHLRSKDHEGAVQVVGVFVREPRGLDDAPGGREVPGAFWT